ncbi:MAG: ribosomal protein S18 acetylase RimI-like enzyme [Arenicella sp.]|jgi:ribosomal protein S18 acetylase RimI-like enzyme
MLIRNAEKKDIQFIVEMIADDKLGAQREDYKLPLPQVYLDAFANIFEDANQELMVVDLDEKVIGCFQLSFIQYLTYQGGIRAQIEGVRIHTDFRSKGIGKQMFEWAIERSKERKAHVLQLTTDKKRPEALKFYEDLGFKASHEGMKLHF